MVEGFKITLHGSPVHDGLHNPPPQEVLKRAFTCSKQLNPILHNLIQGGSDYM